MVQLLMKKMLHIFIGKVTYYFECIKWLYLILNMSRIVLPKLLYYIIYHYNYHIILNSSLIEQALSTITSSINTICIIAKCNTVGVGYKDIGNRDMYI